MNAPLTGIVTVTLVGGSLGLVLPDDAIEELGLTEGTKLSIRRTPDGLELPVVDDDYDRTIRIAHAIMDRYRDALSELAK